MEQEVKIYRRSIMEQEVKIARGKVVGIGKVKIPRTSEYNEIPMLSFLVIEDTKEGVISSCMHFQLDGYGTTDRIAVDNMIENIKAFLKVNFSTLSSGEAWLNLKDLSHVDQDTLELWNAYRDVQFNLAAQGISMDNVEILKERISQMEQRIKQLESEKNQLRKEHVPLILDYQRVVA